MKDKDSYIDNRMQNTFTAYLIKAIRGVRQGYLAKRNKIRIHEDYLEEMLSEPMYGFEEYDIYEESQRGYLSDLEDHRLFKAVMRLKDSEREIIYLHIFEERTFREIGFKLHLSESSVKGRYYYALTKIRNRMKGDESEF